MSLVWDKDGDKIYQIGIDRGVLYLDDVFPEVTPGVAWNGLVSVVDKTVGDAPSSYYYDGVKYLVMPAGTEFAATINAYTYPDEFEACQGVDEHEDGVQVTSQSVKQFDLSYRTKVGNDIQGTDFAYKIHLIYNAIADPSDKTYTTIDSSPNPATMAWDIVTTAEEVPGFAPSAHLIVSSDKVPNITYLEDMLYGNGKYPHMPTPEELFDLLELRFVFVIPTPNPNLLPSFAGSGDMVFSVSDTEVYSIDTPAEDVRPVFSTNDLTVLDTILYAGLFSQDLVYDENTGILYKIGE